MSDVWLSLINRDALILEATRTAPRETGGVVMGYRAGGAIVITHVIGPGPRAQHGPHDFLPDHEYHEEEIGRIYKATYRRATYLGDWHTHPGGTSTLSLLDRRTMRRIARSPEARCPDPLMIILSGGDPWQITIHQLLEPHWLRRVGTNTPRIYEET